MCKRTIWIIYDSSQRFSHHQGASIITVENNVCDKNMISIEEALKSRIQASNSGKLEERLKWESTEYQKQWAQAVQFFQKRLNDDRTRDNMPTLSFIAVRQKIVAVREISDLRWFYTRCQSYSKKEGKTFSQCFFGALKIRQ